MLDMLETLYPDARKRSAFPQPDGDSFIHIFLPSLCKRLRDVLHGNGPLPTATELDGILNLTALLGHLGVDTCMLVVELLERVQAKGQSMAVVHACKL